MNQFYAYTDKALKYLRRYYIKRFNAAKMQINADMLNVVPATKSLYSNLENETIKVFLRIAREKYKSLRGTDTIEEMSEMWLLDFLSESSPVTGYIWANDTERKRQYCAESLLSNEQTIASCMKKALRYWYDSQAQYADLVADAAALKAYKDSGVERVMWLTVEDERVCKECDSLHGHTFPITNIPAKPHRRCRCILVPVR